MDNQFAVAQVDWQMTYISARMRGPVKLTATPGANMVESDAMALSTIYENNMDLI